MVIALVERGQVRELQRLHDAAGVTAASDEVDTGHHVVRQIATSGTPIPPASPAVHAAGISRQSTEAPARHAGNSRRPSRPAAGASRSSASGRGGYTRDGFPRDGFARSNAKPSRRTQDGYRTSDAGHSGDDRAKRSA